MIIDILSPDKKIYSGEVKSAQFPGTEGSFGLLNNHAPIISTLKAGVINLVDDKNEKLSFNVKGGVVEMQKNKVIVLAE